MIADSSVPVFSIIMPVYNGEDYISAAIESVLDQTFAAWELIVVDDGSTDSTAGIVEKFCETDGRIILLKQTNRKQAAARNKGIKAATGEWLAFIDADDLWLPNKLELQHRCIRNNSELDVIFSDGYTQFQGKPIRLYYHYDVAIGYHKGKELYKKMLFGNFIPVLSLVMKKSWVQVIGLQDEKAPGVEDHDYWLKLCRAGASFYGMQDRLFVYRVHANNFSANLENQNYRSCIIRLNNFDITLLEPSEAARFAALVWQYVKSFEGVEKLEWAQEVRAKAASLGLPSQTSIEMAAVALNGVMTKLRAGLGTTGKNLAFFLVKALYFYPKSRLTKFQRKIGARYKLWINRGHIEVADRVRLSPSADLYFNFKRAEAVSLDVQSMYVGDCSRVNLMEEGARMIAGANLHIGKFCNFNVSGQLLIGNDVLFNNHSTLNCHGEIVIGDNTWFGEGVRLYDHNHRYRDRCVPFIKQGYNNGKIEIGSNVWVGSNTVILANVSIGDGCVIGANNVIYRSVPPNSIVKSRSMDTVEPIVPKAE